jgi:hypothetical protein
VGRRHTWPLQAQRLRVNIHVAAVLNADPVKYPCYLDQVMGEFAVLARDSAKDIAIVAPSASMILFK